MLVPLTYDFARGARANSVLSIVLTIGAASAFVGIVQYAVLNFDGLGRRPQGTLSHWMTYSGTLMLVICARDGAVAIRHVRAPVGRVRDAGAAGRAEPHAHPRRLGRRGGGRGACCSSARTSACSR